MADDSLLPLKVDEKLAVVAGLKCLIDEDRYPLSPRVRMLESILARLQPPKPAPLPPRRYYAPPSKGRLPGVACNRKYVGEEFLWPRPVKLQRRRSAS